MRFFRLYFSPLSATRPYREIEVLLYNCGDNAVGGLPAVGGDTEKQGIIY